MRADERLPETGKLAVGMEPLYALEALLSSGSAPSRATLRTKAEDAIQIPRFRRAAASPCVNRAIGNFAATAVFHFQRGEAIMMPRSNGGNHVRFIRPVPALRSIPFRPLYGGHWLSGCSPRGWHLQRTDGGRKPNQLFPWQRSQHRKIGIDQPERHLQGAVRCDRDLRHQGVLHRPCDGHRCP